MLMPTNTLARLCCVKELQDLCSSRYFVFHRSVSSVPTAFHKFPTQQTGTLPVQDVHGYKWKWTQTGWYSSAPAPCGIRAELKFAAAANVLLGTETSSETVTALPVRPGQALAMLEIIKNSLCSSINGIKKKNKRFDKQTETCCSLWQYYDVGNNVCITWQDWILTKR